MGYTAEWPSVHSSFPGHADWVRSVSVSQDEKWIVSDSDDSTIRIWGVGGLVTGPFYEVSRRTIKQPRQRVVLQDQQSSTPGPL